MAKFLGRAGSKCCNQGVIQRTKRLSLEEVVAWLGSGEILLESSFSEDQIGAMSHITDIDISRMEKSGQYWFHPGDECLTVKLSKYSPKDKPPFRKAKAEFVLIIFLK